MRMFNLGQMKAWTSGREFTAEIRQYTPTDTNRVDPFER